MNKNKQTILLSIVLLLFTFYMAFEIYSFQIIPAKYLFLVFVLIVLIDSLVILGMMYLKEKNKSFILPIILVVSISVVSGFGGFYISQANRFFSSVTSEIKTRNTVSVIVKVSSEYKEIKDLDNKNIGILRSTGIEASSICLEDISKNNVHVNPMKYDGFTSMLRAFYNNEVDGIIMNESFRASILDLEGFENFNDNTKVIFKSAYESEQEGSASQVDDVTKYPFSILITGCDMLQDLEESSRSDVNMIVTVNPETKKILLLSIPRDYYVEMVCDASAGCPNGQLDKLTHSGMHGTETTKKTLEKLFNIEVNYTVKVTFDTLTQLVDALGGIDVVVEPGYATDNFLHDKDLVVVEGKNHLNGKQALAYARERYAYLEGDRQRTKNARQVLIGIIEKAISSNALKNYTTILDTLKGTFTTNMTSDEIKALIQFQLNENPKWDIQQYMVDGTSGSDVSPEFGEALYTMHPDYSTVEHAKELMNAIKDGREVE